MAEVKHSHWANEQHCATCEFWDGQRNIATYDPHIVEIPQNPMGSYGICRNPNVVSYGQKTGSSFGFSSCWLCMRGLKR